MLSVLSFTWWRALKFQNLGAQLVLCFSRNSADLYSVYSLLWITLASLTLIPTVRPAKS